MRGSRHEILLDFDGDKQADIALIDDNHDGDLDTIAVDLAGNGEFDLFLIDTDHNNIPDKGKDGIEMMVLTEKGKA